MRLITEAAHEIAERRGLAFHATEIYRADAVRCDLGLREAFAAGIRSTGDTDPHAFWSRAGHDGMAVVAVTPVAMLFLRCRYIKTSCCFDLELSALAVYIFPMQSHQIKHRFILLHTQAQYVIICV